jgi:hypothetical protein
MDCQFRGNDSTKKTILPIQFDYYASNYGENIIPHARPLSEGRNSYCIALRFFRPLDLADQTLSAVFALLIFQIEIWVG